MARLLDEQRRNLTKQEAALLLMSACCHDIGMSVSKKQEAELLNGRTDTLEVWPIHSRWDDSTGRFIGYY